MDRLLVNIKVKIQSAYDSTSKVNRKLKAYLLQQAYTITNASGDFYKKCYNIK